MALSFSISLPVTAVVKVPVTGYIDTMSKVSSQFLVRPDIVFLNHGSFGACPRSVFEEYQRRQLELERQPVEFLGRRFDDLMRAAREPLAAYVNCDADDLVYVPNATTGLNIVAHSLKMNPGDEIVTTDHEYGALDRTWTFLCEKNGAKYKRVPIPVPLTTEQDFVERVWSAVTPRTRVLFLSHITSPTALVFPAQELVRRARAAGILSIIDGAHVVGQMPLDLRGLDADVYSSNAHKWLCAPKGSAFLYVRRELQEQIEPLVVSWGWRPEHITGTRFVQEQEWQGTRDVAAYLATPRAIQFLQEHDWDTVRVECHALARDVQSKICARFGLAPLSAPDWFAQMVTIPLPPCAREAVKARLYDEFRIEVPIIQWNDRQFVRVSVQAYNDRADVEALDNALARIFA